MPRDRRIQILTLAHLALGGVASVLAQVEIAGGNSESCSLNPTVVVYPLENERSVIVMSTGGSQRGKSEPRQAYRRISRRERSS